MNNISFSFLSLSLSLFFQIILYFGLDWIGLNCEAKLNDKLGEYIYIFIFQYASDLFSSFFLWSHLYNRLVQYLLLVHLLAELICQSMVKSMSLSGKGQRAKGRPAVEA